LRSASVGLPPLEPLEALRHVLRSLGLEPDAIPIDVEEGAARFRSVVAGRRLLVVLDNARSAEQVRPLLPGSATCAVLITSRDRLTGLVAREGAHRVPLDVLSPDDSLTLLERIVGPERVRRDPNAVTELARLCGHLPLALRIAAANLANRPHR